MFLLQIGQAIVKACVAIAAIIAGGRVAFGRSTEDRKTRNNEIFAATTLLVVLGTACSPKVWPGMELGAFITGHSPETEYALQIESDIAPYKGLLLGLFFMTVGMEFSMTLLVQQWRAIWPPWPSSGQETAVVALPAPSLASAASHPLGPASCLRPGVVRLRPPRRRRRQGHPRRRALQPDVPRGSARHGPHAVLGALGNALDDMYENKDVLKLQPSRARSMT